MIKANHFLDNLIQILDKNKKTIIVANKADLILAKKTGLSESIIQRLEFNETAIKKTIKRMGDLKKFDSSAGEIMESMNLKNGLLLNKVRTAIGTIAIIYESRPEVTLDAVCLCVKSGNKVVLKGGSEAINTNLALIKCIQQSLEKSGINKDWVKFIKNKKQFMDLIRMGKEIDLVIARGSYELVKAVTKQSSVPVLAHSAGGARIYIDKSADLDLAKKIIINAKISKPSACNSLDTILIHKDIDKFFKENLVNELKTIGVKVLYSQWDKEFLDLAINIKMVNNIEDAVEFVKKYSKGHSEGIIAQDKAAIEKFVNSIDCAAVFINCSTRFHDGFEFGMGAEMGISTGKLHARGPVGLKELTTYRWEVYGQGQIRTCQYNSNPGLEG